MWRDLVPPGAVQSIPNLEAISSSLAFAPILLVFGSIHLALIGLSVYTFVVLHQALNGKFSGDSTNIIIFATGAALGHLAFIVLEWLWFSVHLRRQWCCVCNCELRHYKPLNTYVISTPGCAKFE